MLGPCVGPQLSAVHGPGHFQRVILRFELMLQSMGAYLHGSVTQGKFAALHAVYIAFGR